MVTRSGLESRATHQAVSLAKLLPLIPRESPFGWPWWCMTVTYCLCKCLLSYLWLTLKPVSGQVVLLTVPRFLSGVLEPKWVLFLLWPWLWPSELNLWLGCYHPWTGWLRPQSKERWSSQAFLSSPGQGYPNSHGGARVDHLLASARED